MAASRFDITEWMLMVDTNICFSFKVQISGQNVLVEEICYVKEGIYTLFLFPSIPVPKQSMQIEHSEDVMEFYLTSGIIMSAVWNMTANISRLKLKCLNWCSFYTAQWEQ